MLSNKIRISQPLLSKLKKKYGVNTRLNVKFYKERLEHKVKKLDLRRKKKTSYKYIEFYKNINSYKGTRHKRSLPARGQRTHTNAKTNKNKKKNKFKSNQIQIKKKA
jgi:small subunit ribosomal protein S13